MFDKNIWNHSTVSKQTRSGCLKCYLQTIRLQIIYIYIYTYQISKTGKADQSKHTPEKRNKDPYINQSDQTRVIYTGNKSEFKSHWVPHIKGLVPPMFSDESNVLETYTYIYNTYVRTKEINSKNTNLFVDLILKYILILSLNLQQTSLYLYIYIYIYIYKTWFGIK